MKKNISRNLASVVAGAALFLPLSQSKAQGVVETVNWSGIVNTLSGTGNGLGVGSVVNGSFTINPSSLLYIGGGQGPNGEAGYTFDNAQITMDGVTTTENLGVLILNNCLDSAQPQHSANAIQFTWNGGNDDLVINFPVSAAPDCTAASIQLLLNQGLAGSLPYSGDAFFDVYDAAGMNGGHGDLITLDPAAVAAPEPSAYGLGAAGAAGLLLLRRFFPGKKQSGLTINN